MEPLDRGTEIYFLKQGTEVQGCHLWKHSGGEQVDLWGFKASLIYEARAMGKTLFLSK